MDSEGGKYRWLKGAALLCAMLVIFQLEMFFPGMEPRQTFVRTTIAILAFIPFAVLYRRHATSKRWVAFFMKLACGLFALNLLVLFVWQQPTALGAFSRLANWSGEWLPAFIVLPFAIYSISKTIIKEHRSPKG